MRAGVDSKPCREGITSFNRIVTLLQYGKNKIGDTQRATPIIVHRQIMEGLSYRDTTAASDLASQCATDS